MLFKLFLLFTLVPLAELFLLIQVGRWMGSAWLVIALVLATGMIGAALARWQGLQVWRQIPNDLARGTLPADSILSGVLILVAGALLVTPGLMTDAVGFCLLIPPLRRVVSRRLKSWLRRKIEQGTVTVHTTTTLHDTTTTWHDGTSSWHDETDQ